MNMKTIEYIHILYIVSTSRLRVGLVLPESVLRSASCNVGSIEQSIGETMDGVSIGKSFREMSTKITEINI